MSPLTFKAVISGVHFDPKKGILKIQLEATSYVSMDKLTSLGPQDESIRITLESEQTKIIGVEDTITLGEKGAKRLDEAARKLAEEEEEAEGVPDDPLTTPYTGGDDDDEEEHPEG